MSGIALDHIVRAVCDEYYLNPSALKGPKRYPEIAVPRMLAMALARRMTTRSLPSIGKYFGNRDHTTVMHACGRIEGARHNSRLDAAAIERVALRAVLIAERNTNSGAVSPTNRT